jgi:uncharacterized caspase-like protein
MIMAHGQQNWSFISQRPTRLIFAAKLDETQGGSGKLPGLYSEVLPIYLPSALASEVQIFRSLETISQNMSKGDGRDVAVMLISSHGATVDGDFYLLPNGVDASTPASIKASAISAEQLQKELSQLASHGFVLVLIDACRSGALTNTGLSLAPDADRLRLQMAHGGVFVLTSASGTEDSLEDPRWGHGAFTKILLDALAGDAVQGGHGVISVGELTAYLQKHLPELTHNVQNLGVNPDFQHVTMNIFLTGN